MNVGELRKLVEGLPDDLPVHLMVPLGESYALATTARRENTNPIDTSRAVPVLVIEGE